MTCQWCGDRHGVDQLCQRAQRGMARRSFCFLFGAGIVGAMIAKPSATGLDLSRLSSTTRIQFKGLDGKWIDITDRVRFSGNHAIVSDLPPGYVRALVTTDKPLGLHGLSGIVFQNSAWNS